MLNTVLGQDFGLQYNPKKIAAASAESLRDQSFFDKADDVFLSGLLGEHKMGTCASMPVLLVAVGRRLGYPLKLVGAKGHLFSRWDDGKIQRNFECTNGIACFPDSHYQKWPFPITDEEVKAAGICIHFHHVKNWRHSLPRNDGTGQGRGLFRLHPGSSEGCVTTDDLNDFAKVASILNSTKTTEVKDSAGRVRTYYGKMEVLSAPRAIEIKEGNQRLDGPKEMSIWERLFGGRVKPQFSR